MKTALCLGGAASLHDDIAALPIKYDGVVACNDAGTVWAGELDAWVSLHPEKFGTWKTKRLRSGYPPAKNVVAHVVNKHATVVSQYTFANCGGGSSGLYAAKYALHDLGFDRAVLCGIPMTPTPHFFDQKDWTQFHTFRRAWLNLPEHVTDRMRSMSGWTRVLLGHPRDWADGSEHDKPNDPSSVAA